MVRLRQAVLAARELDPVVERLRREFGLGEPFSDPAVAYFGLENAVFAIGDTFLEVVSPVNEDTAAGRLLDRRGAECCGYMAMFQTDDAEAARSRAAVRGVREVFSVALDDISEAHFHPADIGGAIVSVSEPVPPDSWRWGGPGWRERAVPGGLTGLTVGVTEPDAVRARWEEVLGDLEGIEFGSAEPDAGIVEIRADLGGAPVSITP